MEYSKFEFVEISVEFQWNFKNGAFNMISFFIFKL